MRDKIKYLLFLSTREINPPLFKPPSMVSPSQSPIRFLSSISFGLSPIRCSGWMAALKPRIYFFFPCLRRCFFLLTPLESVWGTVSNSVNEDYFKGAPMKMSTLLATANQKLSAFIRRRSFSERPRWLAAFGMWLRRILSLVYRVLPVPFADVQAYLTHSFHTQAVPIRETEPERELLTVSKGNAFGCPEGIPRGRGQIIILRATRLDLE